MKTTMWHLAFLLTAIALQTSTMPLFSNHWQTAGILLTYIMAQTILKGFPAFLSWAIVAGILFDLVAGLPIGTNVIIFVVAAYLVSFFSKRFLIEARGMGMISMATLVLIATFFSHALLLLVNGNIVITTELGYYWRILKPLGFMMIVNIFFFFFWYFLLRYIDQKFMFKRNIISL